MTRLPRRLFNAIVADCERLHRFGVAQALTRAAAHPQLVSGDDMTNWRNHMSPVERELLEAAIEARIWSPEE